MDIKQYNTNSLLSDDVEYYPINIDLWLPYYMVDEHKESLQTSNLIDTLLYNGYTESIKFAYTAKMKINLDEIYFLLGKIKAKDTTSIIEDEVFYTTKIEGAETTMKRTSEIHSNQNITNLNYSEKMVYNSFEATKLLSSYGNKINDSILRTVWDKLIDGVCENDDIKGTLYRNGEVGVGKHIAPPSYLVKNLMGQFIDFYSSDYLNDTPFIKASLLHYMFETIHPFCDGNGRMGRMLMNNYLINQGIDIYKVVSISKFIDKYRLGYDTMFEDSENCYNDCTPFIDYMLTVILLSLKDAYKSQNNE